MEVFGNLSSGETKAKLFFHLLHLFMPVGDDKRPRLTLETGAGWDVSKTDPSPGEFGSHIGEVQWQVV